MPLLKVICQHDPYFAQLGQIKYHDETARKNVIDYCLQPDKTSPELIGGIGVNIGQATYEMTRLAQAYGKDSGLRLRHWILSFSPQEARRFRKRKYEMLKNIAWYAAEYYGNEYQTIFAVHTDGECPHIHFVMNTVNFVTGSKYGGKKKDYFQYQKYLSDFFERYGMKLEVGF